MTRVKIKRGDSGVCIEVVGIFSTEKYKSFDWYLSKRLTGALSSHFNKGIFSKGDVVFQETGGRRASAVVNFSEFDWCCSSVEAIAAEIKQRVLRVKRALWIGVFPAPEQIEQTEFIV